MDDGFGMHEDPDAVVGEPEELMRFNHFQRLVEHACAVDGDPLAHRPVRVARRLGHRRGCQPFQRPVAEGAARGGQGDGLDGVEIARLKALKHRRMFGIDRQDRGPAGARLAHQQRPGGDQAFLVRERQRAAPFHHPQPRHQPRCADDRGQRPVRRHPRRLVDRGLARRRPCARPRQRVPQAVQQAFVGDYRDLGPQRARHLRQPRDVAAAGQGDGAVGVGAARPHQQVERAFTDRAGGAKDRNAAHLSCRSSAAGPPAP